MKNKKEMVVSSEPSVIKNITSEILRGLPINKPRE